MEDIMRETLYFGTASGLVSRYKDSVVEHYGEISREFQPTTTRETIYDLDTSMKALTQEEAEVIMERSSAIADKRANKG